MKGGTMAATMDEQRQQANGGRPWYASPLVGLAVLVVAALATAALVVGAIASSRPSTGECNDRDAEIAVEYREARRLLAEGDIDGMIEARADADALAAKAQADGCELGL